MRNLSAFLLLALAVSGCATRPVTTTPDPAAVRLADLMAERLEVSRFVAWYKFQNNLPVRDAAREAEVIAAFVREGAARGLPESRTEPFITAQIRASRRLQQELLGKWNRGGTLPAYPPWDLRRHVRPRLDRIGREMLEALAQIEASPSAASTVDASLRAKGFPWFVTRVAVAPLR